MLFVGGEPLGTPGQDDTYCGLHYPDGDKITRHLAERLRKEPIYQHDKLKQALAVLKRRRLAVDCGAWVGGWSVELARHFDSVLAIEANPDNARCVAKNLRAQPGRPPNFEVLNAAVGDRTGNAGLDPGDRPNVGTSVLDAGEQSIPIWRLDDLPQLRDVVGLDYLKIHVNGMELMALRGAHGLIRKHRPVMTVVLKPAIEDYGATAEEARDFLRSLDYQPAGGERPYEIWAPR